MEETGNNNGKIVVAAEIMALEITTTDDGVDAVLLVPYGERTHTSATSNEVVMSGTNLPFITTHRIALTNNSSELSSNVEVMTVDQLLQAAATIDNTEMADNHGSAQKEDNVESKLSNDNPVNPVGSTQSNEMEYNALNLLASAALLYGNAPANNTKPKSNGVMPGLTNQGGPSVVTVIKANIPSSKPSKNDSFTEYYVFLGCTNTAVEKITLEKYATLPDTPTAVKIFKVDDGFNLSWKPPTNNVATEYTVYLGVLSTVYKIRGRNNIFPTTSAPLIYKIVYQGPYRFCRIEADQLVDPFFEANTAEAFLFTIVAGNENGYAPIGIQVAWPQGKTRKVMGHFSSTLCQK